MITNKDLVEFGRKQEQERDINRRVYLMSRCATIRECIKQYQVTLAALEKELEVENEKYRRRIQTRLEL